MKSTINIALLGDSIFDNVAYVESGIDVIKHLRGALPDGVTATLLARDGSRIGDIGSQLHQLPADTSHIIVSVGGNDAIDSIGVFDEPVESVAGALSRLAELKGMFHYHYHRMLCRLIETGLRIGLCTIYNPRFPDPILQSRAVAALALFNDCILQEAAKTGIPVAELRQVCTEDEDYANPIEPSDIGGAKIARVLVRMAVTDDIKGSGTVIYR